MDGTIRSALVQSSSGNSRGNGCANPPAFPRLRRQNEYIVKPCLTRECATVPHLLETPPCEEARHRPSQLWLREADPGDRRRLRHLRWASARQRAQQKNTRLGGRECRNLHLRLSGGMGRGDESGERVLPWPHAKHEHTRHTAWRRGHTRAACAAARPPLGDPDQSPIDPTSSRHHRKKDQKRRRRQNEIGSSRQRRMRLRRCVGNRRRRLETPRRIQARGRPETGGCENSDPTDQSLSSPASSASSADYQSSPPARLLPPTHFSPFAPRGQRHFRRGTLANGMFGV